MIRILSLVIICKGSLLRLLIQVVTQIIVGVIAYRALSSCRIHLGGGPAPHRSVHRVHLVQVLRRQNIQRIGHWGILIVNQHLLANVFARFDILLEILETCADPRILVSKSVHILEGGRLQLFINFDNAVETHIVDKSFHLIVDLSFGAQVVRRVILLQFWNGLDIPVVLEALGGFES